MQLTGSRVLLTGGAGFISSHVADRLAAAGVGALVVVDDLSLGREENLAAARRALAALDFRKVDLADEAACRRALHGAAFDFCFHLAVIPLPASLLEPKRVVDANVLMTTTVCEMVRAGRIRRLIHFSSSEVYGTARAVPMTEEHPLDAETPYAASKVAADSVVRAYHRTFGIDAVTLRPFNNFGPRQNDKAYAGVIPIVIGCVLADRPVTVFGDGAQTRDFIYVEDTARAAVALAERDDVSGRVFNIGGGRETSVSELVRLILDTMQRSQFPIEYGPPRPGDVRRHCAGIERARGAFGFAPRIGLREGMERTVAWYLEAR